MTNRRGITSPFRQIKTTNLHQLSELFYLFLCLSSSSSQDRTMSSTYMFFLTFSAAILYSACFKSAWWCSTAIAQEWRAVQSESNAIETKNSWFPVPCSKFLHKNLLTSLSPGSNRICSNIFEMSAWIPILNRRNLIRMSRI
ncbi:hypothetical protein T11_10993 [Trichinella zimbabwensis]|uniref:Uncharacterized protein n=1 Tax=Trichinella zimbabwensis TaxID=268475 RepID=A0A0V1I3V1_9BILA|nr:hypothetical protein T11_10993 [Trichinella zimbabwensis]